MSGRSASSRLLLARSVTTANGVCGSTCIRTSTVTRTSNPLAAARWSRSPLFVPAQPRPVTVATE